MQRQEHIQRAGRQRKLAMLAHEDIPALLGVLRILGVQAPGVRAAGFIGLGKDGAGAVAVDVVRGGDAVVIFGDELAHGAERLFRGELIAAVGDKIAVIEFRRDRQIQRRLRREGLGLHRVSRCLGAALGDQHDDQNQQHKRRDRDQHRQISAQPQALLSSFLVHCRTSIVMTFWPEAQMCTVRAVYS